MPRAHGELLWPTLLNSVNPACPRRAHRQVEELGVSNLIGTPLLRGYMHGYFMDMKLYTRCLRGSTTGGRYSVASSWAIPLLTQFVV